MHLNRALAVLAALCTVSNAYYSNGHAIEFKRGHRYENGLGPKDDAGTDIKDTFSRENFEPGQEEIRKGLLEMDDVYRRKLAAQEQAIQRKLQEESPGAAADDDLKVALKARTDVSMGMKYTYLYKRWTALHDKGAKNWTPEDEKEMADYARKMEFYEDRLEEQTARMMLTAESMEKRFGKWKPINPHAGSTGEFGDEKKLWGNLQDAIKKGDKDKIHLAMSDLAGLDVAKEYMREAAPALNESRIMIRYMVRKGKSWLARVWSAWFRTNVEKDRKKMLERYLTKQLKAADEKAPSADAKKLEDEVNAIKTRTKNGAEAKGFKDKIGDVTDYGKLDPLDAEYLSKRKAPPAEQAQLQYLKEYLTGHQDAYSPKTQAEIDNVAKSIKGESEEEKFVTLAEQKL